MPCPMVSATGDRAQVARGLSSLIERYAPDELILSSAMHDPAARLRSHEIAMEALQGEALAEHARR